MTSDFNKINLTLGQGALTWRTFLISTTTMPTTIRLWSHTHTHRAPSPLRSYTRRTFSHGYQFEPHQISAFSALFHCLLNVTTPRPHHVSILLYTYIHHPLPYCFSFPSLRAIFICLLGSALPFRWIHLSLPSSRPSWLSNGRRHIINFSLLAYSFSRIDFDLQ